MLAEKLVGDLKVAMKARDKMRLSVIRQIRAQIQNTEIAKQQALDDSGILGVISKEAKQRRESIGEFKKADRQDLVAQEEAELAILLEYLPQQMSREEIVTVARRMIDEMEARGPGDKGKVMPRLVADLKGKAEGREIGEVVTELLGG
ncbi:MAG: GatB/YqeY domain-containing protein [Dehalococcoidia bacterium]